MAVELSAQQRSRRSFSSSISSGSLAKPFGVTALREVDIRAGVSASDYVTDIPGVTGPIESGGNSASARLTADRVLSVNEARRWDTGASLTVKENEQLEFLGTTIDTASRRLSLF